MRYGIAHICFGAAILIIDIVTKMYAVTAFENRYRLIPGLRFEVLYNTGITLGITSSYDIIRMMMFILQIALIVGLIIYSGMRILQDRPAWAPIMITAGGIGNMLSRIWYPGVVDFIIIGYGPYTWPAFNTADVAIVVGVAVWLWQYYKEQKYV